jgi:hypothetical protein
MANIAKKSRKSALSKKDKADLLSILWYVYTDDLNPNKYKAIRLIKKIRKLNLDLQSCTDNLRVTVNGKLHLFVCDGKLVQEIIGFVKRKKKES